jgi:hypothetical protein
MRPPGAVPRLAFCDFHGHGRLYRQATHRGYGANREYLGVIHPVGEQQQGMETSRSFLLLRRAAPRPLQQPASRPRPIGREG